MGKLVYIPITDSLILYETERDSKISGGKRKCGFSNVTKEFNINDLLPIFGFNSLEEVPKIKTVYGDEYLISNNTNPYIIYLNNRCMTYFGDDLPRIRFKTVKTKTKHYMKWAMKSYKKNEPEEYGYLEVDDESKLFFFYGCHYEFFNGERIISGVQQPMSNCDIAVDFYIARLDWIESQYEKMSSEKKQIEEAKKREEEERLIKLEKQKHLDGFCSHCGQDGAEYVLNPYMSDIYGVTEYEWLCSACYDSLIGDI